MIRTIRLYGVLGSKFGRVHRMDVSCAAEAMRALSSQIKGFAEFLVNSKDRGLGYSIFYGKANLREEQLRVPAGRSEIRIAPMILGSKNGGFFSIILGAVLIFAAFIPGVNALVATAFLNLGISMVLGGVVQLLTPMPKGKAAKDKPQNEPSYAFDGPVNTEAQGHCIPVLYGELIVGSAVVSAGISAKDHTYVPATTTPAGSGGGGGRGMWDFIHDVAEGTITP